MRCTRTQALQRAPTATISALRKWLARAVPNGDAEALMAKHVGEIMNRELFAFRPNEAQEEARRFLLALEITAAPVVDARNRLVGFVSLRDLARQRGEKLTDCMHAPVDTIAEDATIEHAADVFARTKRHHLVVVDDAGNPKGMLSALDALCGVRGIPVTHPSTFPHYDRATGLTWTDDHELALVHAEAAPNGPGILSLVHGGARMEEQVVWAEACENVRTRVFEILEAPSEELHPALFGALQAGRLRFRAAPLPDDWLDAASMKIPHERRPLRGRAAPEV
jgi:CBS domain-containing protein